MKPLNIALIRQRYTDFGGAERFVANAMEALRQEGAQLTVVTRQWKQGVSGPALICNPFYLGSVWRDWSFARCVCGALEKHPFDLVQSHERIPCCDVYRAGDGVHREWLRQRRRSMGFLGRLGIALNPYHHYTMAAERRLFASPQLKAVICNSRMVKEEIRYHFGVPEDRLHVIYSGVDTMAYHPGLSALHRESVRARHAIPQEAPLLLYVGSGFERKGVGTLLAAFARLPDAPYLMVVGKDKHQAGFQRLAARLGIRDRVRFTGGLADVKPLYGAADAFVLPTRYDPFPTAALEAFACGLPVITSTKSGAAELIENGRNGYVCDALDVDGLASSMEAALGPGLASRQAAARATVEALDVRATTPQLFQLYQRLTV
ncbi:MAG: glycosyltransferase family 4 protein [Betaproteobacteria bacterium]